MPVASLSSEVLVIDDPARPEAGLDPALVESCVEPAEARYLVRLDPPIDRSRGGILLPDQSLPLARTGVVVAAGKGAWSEDGKQRLPMHAKKGDRILFEYAAGYTLPRVPEKTTPGKERGYKLVRDGSVIAVISGSGPWPEFLEDADAVVPRLTMTQDWLLVHNDRPQAEHVAGVANAAGKGAHTRRKVAGRALGGIRLLIPSARSQVEQSERWTGTVVKRGPGLILAREGMTSWPHLCEEGDRVLYSTAFPLMSLPGVDGYAVVRERPCVEAVIR